MKPANVRTKIFLDSGDPVETKQAMDLLGFLDGQTTNPSLISKNPDAAGKKFSAAEILNFYEGVVKEVSSLIPAGSVSIEVYADKDTPAEEMLEQGEEFFKWIPNAHIKFPTTEEGLKAAGLAVKDGLRVNMTLVFSQEQAAAVYAATKGAVRGQVYLSPFIGRLDDRGENGMDLIANIIKMYGAGDRHVEVLTASVRSLDHFMEALKLGSDIITAPLKVIKEWAADGKLTSLRPSPHEGRVPDLSAEALAKAERRERLQPIPYQQISLDKPWQEYNIQHDLTDRGIEKFAADWNSLIDKI